MHQAMHIFRKDVELLRYHVAITLFAAAAFCSMTAANLSGPGPTLIVLAISWWFLIAAVIHAEPLPGTGHFWLTRPYDRLSLFAAKALFVFAFVNAPLGIADLIIFHATGFSVFENVSGLVWTQVLLVCAFEVPVAAIASVTSGLLGFLTATLFLLLLTLAAYVVTSVLHVSLAWGHFEWVREYLVFGLTFVLGTGILYGQYARRATQLSRIAAIAGPVLLFACAAVLPWTVAFAIQSWLRPNRLQPLSIGVKLDSERRWAGRIYRGEQDRLVADIPIKIDRIPEGADLKVYGVRMNLRAPDGQTQVVEQPPSESFETDSGMVSLRIVLPAQWYEKYRREALQVSGILYFALYNKARYFTVRSAGHKVGVPGVGLCIVDAKSLFCGSAFRPPTSYVDADVTEQSIRGVIHSIAHMAGSGDAAPFPAEFNMDPVFRWFSPTLAPIRDVLIQRAEPIAYTAQSFGLDRLVLAEFKFQE